MNKDLLKKLYHCCLVDDDTTEKPKRELGGPVRRSGDIMSRLNVLTTGIL